MTAGLPKEVVSVEPHRRLLEPSLLLQVVKELRRLAAKRLTYSPSVDVRAVVREGNSKQLLNGMCEVGVESSAC